MSEVSKSLERAADHLKWRIQFFDRLAALSGAILALSIPAFTTLRGPGRIIMHPYLSLWTAILGWVFLFVALIGCATTHYLLIEYYAVWTNNYESNVLGCLFNNAKLMQERLIRSVGGDVNILQAVPIPGLPFGSKPWHKHLSVFLSKAEPAALITSFLGALGIFLFLIFSSV